MICDNCLVVGFKMEGHAGYNVNGPDIVCAALSATSQMTVNGVLDCTGLDISGDAGEFADEFIKANDPQKGLLWVELGVDFIEEIKGTVMLAQLHCLFKAFELYIELLVEQYPQFICLERRQRDDK